MVSSVFSELSKFLNEKIPPDIITILERSGYDTKTALSNLNSVSIEELEKFVCDDKSILDNTTYQKDGTFKFKPGHRSFIVALPNQIIKMTEKEDLRSADKFPSDCTGFSYLLNTLINNAKLNSNKDPKGYRYDETIRYFATYIYIMCGRACYETLSANLPIPKAQTILGYISQFKTRIIEGELRHKELNRYLNSIKVRKCVWLSEDASGIVAKIEYDPQTNQMIGIVLPISHETGFPIPFTYLARSATEIETNIDKPKSSYVYMIIAQPLKKSAHPFILQIFGTDNKFKSENVLKRWKNTVDILERNGIEVVGFSADGDSRLLSSMRNMSSSSSLEANNPWFGDPNRNICFMQDVVHIGTKLRNRLLKPSVLMKIGSKVASVSHLKILLNQVSKDEHGLTYSVICPDDRQNYDSLVRTMQPNVREALSKYVSDSEASIEYIRICSEITSSLYQEDLPPLERLFRLWHSTYFLRAWRLNLTQATTSNISCHFVTRNAYACIELNAKNLIILIKKLRDNGLSDLFLPTLFNSQPCEETFRKMRSMGTVNFTKINFSMLELMHLVGRVEMLNDIIYFKLADQDVKFPRHRLTHTNSKVFDLSSDIDIKICLQRAQDATISDASKFGIHITAAEINDCELRDIPIKFTEPSSNDDIDLMIRHTECRQKKSIPCDSLKDYSEKKLSPNESSPFLEVIVGSRKKSIRKSSFIGLLSNSKDKLSSDRLKRTQNSSNQRCVRRELEFVDVSQNQNLMQKEEIQIGDWCLFHNDIEVSTIGLSEFILGNILSFKYVHGRTEKEKQYSLDFAPVRHSSNVRGVEVLSSWYGFDGNGKVNIDNDCYYINIDRYIATIPREFIYTNQNKQVQFSEKYLNGFRRDFEKILTQ